MQQPVPGPFPHFQINPINTQEGMVTLKKYLRY